MNISLFITSVLLMLSSGLFAYSASVETLAIMQGWFMSASMVTGMGAFFAGFGAFMKD